MGIHDGHREKMRQRYLKSGLEGFADHEALELLAPQLYRKAKLSDAEQETVLNSVDRVGAYLLQRFIGERREVVYQLCLDRKGKLLACKRLGEGGVASADLDIRKLMENAILTSASAVILAHNHPSGIALPSQEDYGVTDRARKALATIGVALTDHIIVADGDYVSMADSGYLA